MIETYDADQMFVILTSYDWRGNPRQDFTLSVYSVDGNVPTDTDGNTNMMHCDGSSPSEFDYMLTHNELVHNQDLPYAWKTDPATEAIYSLLDVFEKADTTGHFFSYLRYNWWVLFDWFGVTRRGIDEVVADSE
jgi:hypothetical protein